jgi:hypothetical protein
VLSEAPRRRGKSCGKGTISKAKEVSQELAHLGESLEVVVEIWTRPLHLEGDSVEFALCVGRVIHVCNVLRGLLCFLLIICLIFERIFSWDSPQSRGYSAAEFLSVWVTITWRQFRFSSALQRQYSCSVGSVGWGLNNAADVGSPQADFVQRQRPLSAVIALRLSAFFQHLCSASASAFSA